MRVESEYRRGGTLAYMAAYDVHHAKVFGQFAPNTGIEPFTALAEKVMTSEPYAAPTGVLGRRQRLLPPRLDASAGWTRRSRTRSWSTPGARVLAEPDRDLLLHRATQAITPDHYANLAALAAQLPRSRPATTKAPSPSTGDTAATTSTNSSTGSPPDPRRTTGRDH